MSASRTSRNDAYLCSSPATVTNWPPWCRASGIQAGDHTGAETLALHAADHGDTNALDGDPCGCRESL
jgi:hypothetical protein